MHFDIEDAAVVIAECKNTTKEGLKFLEVCDRLGVFLQVPIHESEDRHCNLAWEECIQDFVLGEDVVVASSFRSGQH